MAWIDFVSQEWKSIEMRDILSRSQVSARFRTPTLIFGESGSGKTSLGEFILSQSCGQGQYFIHQCGNGKIDNLITFLMAAKVRGVMIEGIERLAISEQLELLSFAEKNRDHFHFVFSASDELRLHLRKGQFLAGLYYFASVMSLSLPPLKSRNEDIISLASYFINLYGSLYNRSSLLDSTEELEQLLEWHWPGNIRELESLLERAVLRSTYPAQLYNNIHQEINARIREHELGDIACLSLVDHEKKLIRTALQLNAQNRTHAAKALGISVRTLRNKIKEYGFADIDANPQEV